MATKNIALKIAIVQDGRRHSDIAAASGIPVSKFSLIVNGHWNPSEDDQNAIANALNRSRAELFEASDIATERPA